MDEMPQGNRGFYNCLGYKDILVQVSKRGNIQIYHANLAIFTVILGSLPEVCQSVLPFSLQCQATVAAQPLLERFSKRRAANLSWVPNLGSYA